MAKEPECFSRPELFEAGLGEVVVARYKSNDRVEAGVFLVDLFCLGVLNGYFYQGNEREFREKILKLLEEEEAASRYLVKDGAWGRKLVEGAVAYAHSLGFFPHRDYKAACRVFGGIKAENCAETFVFGQDGKPLYVCSPYEKVPKFLSIIRQLERRCGSDGFKVIGSPSGLSWTEPETQESGEEEAAPGAEPEEGDPGR